MARFWLLIASVAALMTNCNCRVTDCEAESVNRTVKVKDPTCVGVPDRFPDADRLMPSGKVPLETAKVYGAVPPEPAMIAL